MIVNKLISISAKRLKYEILIFATCSLLASVFTYSVTNFAGTWLVNKRIEPYIISSDINKNIAKYQKYVTGNKIASKEWNRLRNWASDDKRLFLLSVSGDKPLKSTSGVKNKETVNRSSGIQTSVVIIYKDARVLSHFVYIRPRDMLHQTKTVIVLLLSFAVFLSVFYYFLNKKLNYISVLEHGISILESGDMKYKIPVSGDDELSRLAISLNTMSQSFMEKDISEKRAIQTSKDVIGELSHDIRTPLTIISGYVPILIEDPSLTAQQKEYLNLIRLKTELMSKRINDLLDYSVIYSGQQEINKSSVQVRDVIAQLIAEMKPFHLIVENNTEQDSRILVDEMLISRVFDNLLSNVYKYANLDKEMQMACTEENHMLVIILKNTVREDSCVGGKSLGLKISRYIVECHGGELTTSCENGYFVARLSIPLLGV